MREQGRSKTGNCFAATRQTAANEYSWPAGERQEHLDAVVSFGGAGQRRRLFWELDILTIKWATGDLPEECRFLLGAQLIFLKKEKDPISKQFDDDDEWIRSVTEAQEVTTDVPEDSVTYEHQEHDPQKFGPFKWRRSCGSMSRGDFWHLVREKLQPLTTSMLQIGVGTPGGAEALASFFSSSAMNG